MKIDLFSKIKKPEIAFGDLEKAYRYYFYKKFIIALLAFACFCIILILAKAPLYILIAFAIFLCYLLSVFFTIYKSLTNQIDVLDTICSRVEKKEYALFGTKGFTFLSCKMVLKTKSGLNVLVDVPYSSSFKENDIVRLYLDKMALDKINDNTYKVINYIFIHTVSSEG